jgi:diguanylate cyclase (GGDEF)-like protein/PAS domain S-box-containing protein
MAQVTASRCRWGYVTVPASRASWAGTGHRSGPGSDDDRVEVLRRVLRAQRDIACADLDRDVVFSVLAGSVLTVFPAEGAICSQPEGDFIVARAAVGTAGPPIGHRIPKAGTLGGRALRTLEGQLCLDSQTDPRTRADISASTHTRSSIIVPLVHEGEAVGLIAAVSSRPEAFDETDLELLTLLAEVAATRFVAALERTASREIASRAAAVVEAMAEGLVEMDAQGRTIFANRSSQQMLGFTWSVSSGLTAAESGWAYLHEDGSERPYETLPFMLALRTGQPYRDDVLGVRSPAGETWWLLISSVPRVQDGVVLGAVNTFTDITARRAQEEARQTREARLRAAQELTGLAWWELDPRTGAHTWSDAMFQLVGLAPSDLAPTDDEYLAMLHPDDRKAALELRDEGFTTGHHEVYRVVHPDGTVRHLQAWTGVEQDDAGAVTKVTGATIDVTQREQLLDSVAVSRANLAAALELTRTATWDWDLVTDRVLWSDRMHELMGRDPSSPPPRGEDFLAVVHPDDRERMRLVGEETIASGQGEEALYRVVHPDGTVRHVRAWTDVRRAPDGTVTHLWGTAMDITEQAESAALLSASEEQFRVAFDNAPIGMSMIGLSPGNHGRYLRVNAAFEAMLGRTTEELAGMPIEHLTHTEDRERDAGQFALLARGETQTLAFEKRYIHRDGEVVHAWLSSTVVHGGDGEPLYLVTHALDISDRRREQAELERLALTDTLTGLANRTLLNDRLAQALARLHRTGGATAMLLLDVDRFKTVNDSLGHQVGDALLVEVAGRIEAVSRADATVARLGGDEFVVLVEGLPAADTVNAVADRLLEALRRPYDLGTAAEALVSTVSIGIAVATDATRTAGDLYREADLALYRAKDSGRDQYALFDDALRAQADQRMAAETLLRRALADNLLVPVFQPIVDLASGQVRAAEALVRIQDGDRLVLPAEFIDVAEETGLIVEIDARMFERVAAEGARLLDAGALLRRLTTNVSARSLEDPLFVERMRRALTWYGVPGSMIRVELTERSLLSTSPAVGDSLARIRELGLEVGLDDFGTGYSALAYLQRFSLQFLKIDRSFVSRLGSSARDDAVVSAVIDLAHAHDLVVIGEGVETLEQLAALRRMGCDRAQGYLMGRPMPAAELDALLITDPRW